MLNFLNITRAADAPAVNDRVFFASIFLSVAIRLILPFAGANWDMGEWTREADAYLRGDNVYAVTLCNRGPIWHMILAGIRYTAGLLSPNIFLFEWGVSAFCTVVDCLLGYVINRRFGRVYCLLFMLNPISIFISGYHRHCDDLAILIGFLGVLMIEEAERTKQLKQIIIASALLGISMIVKHILIFYPVWLFLRKDMAWGKKLILLMVPLYLLVIVFLPYWLQDSNAIIAHVINYRSWDNAPFWRVMLPSATFHYVKPITLFAFAMLVAGYTTRTSTLVDQFAYYLIVLVVFASAIANQYLAIPVLGIVIFRSWGYVPYVIASTLWLYVFSIDGMQAYWDNPLLSQFDRRNEFATICAMTLLGGLIHQVTKRTSLNSP